MRVHRGQIGWVPGRVGCRGATYPYMWVTGTAFKPCRPVIGKTRLARRYPMRPGFERDNMAPSSVHDEYARFMSMSLREQLLQAGLVSQKEVREAERQLQRQARQQPKQKPAAAGPAPARTEQAAKIARDQALSRKQQEKAKKKALQAQVKQLIEQNCLPPKEGDGLYNFVDGNRVRGIAVDAATRAGLGRGEIVVVSHEARYYLVSAATAARIRERDERAVIAGSQQESAPIDEAYQQFSVPDDLIW